MKLAGGVALLAAPRIVIKLLGLPVSDPSAFWPRLLGGVLVGIAGALYIEGALSGSKGLGLAGAIIVNLAAAAVVAGELVLRRGAPTVRGRYALWALAALLFAVSLAEIAVA